MLWFCLQLLWGNRKRCYTVILVWWLSPKVLGPRHKDWYVASAKLHSRQLHYCFVSIKQVCNAYIMKYFRPLMRGFACDWLIDFSQRLQPCLSMHAVTVFASLMPLTVMRSCGRTKTWRSLTCLTPNTGRCSRTCILCKYVAMCLLLSAIFRFLRAVC